MNGQREIRAIEREVQEVLWQATPAKEEHHKERMGETMAAVQREWEATRAKKDRKLLVVER